MRELFARHGRRLAVIEEIEQRLIERRALADAADLRGDLAPDLQVPHALPTPTWRRQRRRNDAARRLDADDDRGRWCAILVVSERAHLSVRGDELGEVFDAEMLPCNCDDGFHSHESPHRVCGRASLTLTSSSRAKR